MFAGEIFFIPEKLTKLAEELKSRVPDTFQLSAILPCSAFLASRKISNLRVFNNPEHSDSPRLHHSKPPSASTRETVARL